MNSSRSNSIDVFRGLAMLGMVLANYLAGVEWIPAWLKHAPDVGFTITDLVAPMFIFAIGLTYVSSARRRYAADGAWKTNQHFITRFFALLGIGSLISAGEILMQVDGQTINWGVLQAIGVAGLVTLIFIRSNTLTRLVAGTVLLGFYQFMLQRMWLTPVLVSPHGGLLGSISWSAMLLLATVLSDFYHHPQKGNWKLSAASLIVLVLGLALTFWFPISKNRISAPYVLLSVGLSGLIFCGVDVITNALKLPLHTLAVWGRNPLVLYVLHMLLLAIVVVPGVPAWYSQAPIGLVIVQSAALLLILTLVAWQLDKHKRYVSL